MKILLLLISSILKLLITKGGTGGLFNSTISERDEMVLDNAVISNDTNNYGNSTNFCSFQNYIMDLKYELIPGITNYFYNNLNDTLFMVSMLSIYDFTFQFSLYTKNETLMRNIENDNFYFGFHFNSTDIIETFKYLDKEFGIYFNTSNINYTSLASRNELSDIVICQVHKTGGDCKDYYAIKNNITDRLTYYENTNKQIQSKLLY